jgi:hypothetical protein
MTTTKKKVEILEEKIKESEVKITIKKGTQDFIFLWNEQSQIIRELERVLKARFDIAGKPRAISLACKFLLNEIEAEFGKQQSDVKE